MTHDGLLRRVVGPREPGDLRALRTRRLRRKPGDDASTPACFFAEPCGGYRMAKGEGPWEVNNIVAAWNGGSVGKSEGPGTLP